MSGTAIPAIPAPVTADPNFWRQGIEGLNALRDQQAKQAISQIYQRPDVVNPQTGEVDQSRLNALISQSPQAAWNAAGAMQAQGQAATAQGQGVQEQLTAHRSRMAFMLGQMNDLLANGKPIGAGDIATALNNAHFSPSEAAQITQMVNGASGGDPNFDYTGFVKNQVTANLAAKDQIDRLTPKMEFQQTPQGLVAVDTNPNTTKTPPGSALPFGLSPGTKYWDPKGGPDGTGAWVLSGGNVAPGTTTTPSGTGAGGGSGTTDPVSALPKPQALQAIVQRESGGQNIPNRQGPGGTPASTASGFYQMLDTTWQEGASLAGIKNPPARAMQASREDQDAAASALYDKYGVLPWAKSAPGVRTAASAPAPAAPTAPPAPPAGSTARSGTPGGPGTYSGPGFGVLPPAPAPATPLDTRTSPTLRSDIQGGVQVASANPLVPTAVGAPGPASPLVPGDVNAIMQGRANARATPASGVQTAFNALQSGGGPVAAPPVAQPATPAVAPVAAPVRPPAATPSGQLMAEPPLGTGQRVTADITAYTKNAGEVYLHQNNVNTLQNAYHALQLADTGPGTQNLQAARAFLQSFGIATSATGDQATQWAEAHKYLMDFARTQGGLGGTDLQAQLAQGSNASTDIPKPAALAVVRNNIAKERLQMAQVQEANGSNGYVEHTKNFAPSQDLRAYQADIMPPQELKQIEALQKTNPKAFEKFQKSLDIARAHGLISDEDLAAQNQRIRALGP